MIHRYSLSILAASALVLTATGCRHKTAPAIPMPEIPVAEVSQADVPVTMQFIGQTYGKSDINLIARVDGFLKASHFQQGAPVRRSQLLYTIEPASAQSQVNEARANVAKANTQLVEAKSNFRRIKPLVDIDAMSQSDLDNAVAQLGAAEAAVKAAKASLNYAEINLGYTEVRSPVDGVIGPTNANPGDYVGPGSDIPVLNTVSQIDTVIVKFFMPYRIYLNQIDKGGAIAFGNISLEMANGAKYPEPGIFNFIGRAVNPSTGALDVQVSFANPDSLLRPGQFARINATLGVRHNALLVPQKAVNSLQGIYSVYVVDEDDKVAYREVTVGQTVGGMWLVESGLAPGERVATDGFHKLRSGMTVKPLGAPADTTTKK